ncbi:MAG TPA: hypothetical protein VNM90_09505 [Haliangium sp.]|nr:hypothetical protein [Haliangium sp.]
MYKPRWQWVAGYMMAMSVALIGCGDDGGEQERDAAVDDAGGDDAQPADAAPADGSACPMTEELWEDVDLTAFTPLVKLEELDVESDVQLAEAATYWELRRTSPGGDDTIVLSAGDKCAEADDTDLCNQEFDDLTAATGFGPGCPPGSCFYYIAVNRGDTQQVVSSMEELVTFLGNIDTSTEAALIAHAHGYGWDVSTEPAGSAGAVRATTEGYELLVTELTQDCDPIITDRVQLTVATEGEATPARRQIYGVICNACI